MPGVVTRDIKQAVVCGLGQTRRRDHREIALDPGIIRHRIVRDNVDLVEPREPGKQCCGRGAAR